MSDSTFTNEQLDALEAVVRDLHSEANFIAPIGLVESGLVDPAEVSHRDKLQAEALADYAEKLAGRIKQLRYKNRQGGAAA